MLNCCNVIVVFTDLLQLHNLFDLHILLLPYLLQAKLFYEIVYFFLGKSQDSFGLERKESCQCVYIMGKTI